MFQLVAIAAVQACTAGHPDPEREKLEKLEKIHSSLTSTPVEKWQTVPWEIDLLDARKAAVEQGRPLFLWSMNGHPLGCT